MASSFGPDKLCDLVRDGAAEFLVSWAVEYGVARFPEAVNALALAALERVERNPEFARRVFHHFDDAELWPRDPALAGRLAALLERVSPGDFSVTLKAAVNCDPDAGRAVLQRWLDDSELELAGKAAALLPKMAGGVGTLAEALARKPELAPHIEMLPALLLGVGCNPQSAAAALTHLANMAGHRNEAQHAYQEALEALSARAYFSTETSGVDDWETWGARLEIDCRPLVSPDLARRVSRALSKGKGMGAFNALLEAAPRGLAVQPGDESDAGFAAALALLKVFTANTPVRENLARKRPEIACGLLAGVLGRVADWQTSPALDPDTATLQQALETLRSPRPHLKHENGWIARAAAGGADAISELSAMLDAPAPVVVRRAAMALAIMKHPDAQTALTAHAENETVAEVLEVSEPDFLLEASAQELRAALAKGDDEAVHAALASWIGCDPRGDALVEIVWPHGERLLFADARMPAFADFIASHPDPRFLPLVDLWRPGQTQWCEAFAILLSLYAPNDPRLKALVDEGINFYERIMTDDPAARTEVPLLLICARCKSQYRYDVRHVMIAGDLLQRDPAPPLGECARIDDVIECKRCGAIDEYLWPRNAQTILLTQAMLNKTGGPVEVGRFSSTVGGSLTFSEVVERLDKRLAENPDARTYLLLGNAYFNKRKLAQALEVYGQGLERWPDFAELAYQRGLAYSRLKEYAKALADFKSAALSLKPRDKDADALAECIAAELRDAARAAGKPVPLDAVEALDTVFEALPPAPVAAPAALPFPMRRDTLPELGGRMRLTPNDYLAQDDEDVDDDEDWDEDEEVDAEAATLGAAHHVDSLRQMVQDLQKKIIHYATRYVPEKEGDAALTRWLGYDAHFQNYIQARLASGKQEDLHEITQMTEYRIFDWRAAPESKTLLEQFKDAEWAGLTHAEQRQVTGWIERRRCGWYEAEVPDPRRHLTTIRDYLTGDTFQIYDHGLAEKTSPGTMWLSSIFPVAERMEIPGVFSAVPRHIRVPFKRWVLETYEKWKAARAAHPKLNATLPRYFSEQSAEIEHELWRLGQLPPLVVLSTGEALTPGHAIYEVRDRATVRTALEGWKFLQFEGRGEGNELSGDQYLWSHPAGGPPLPFAKATPATEDASGRRVLIVGAQRVDSEKEIVPFDAAGAQSLGTITFGGAVLEVMASSSERLAWLQEHIEAKLGRAVKYLRAKREAAGFVERIFAERASRKGARGNPDVLQEHGVGQELESKLMQRWVDTSIPALSGKTPRQAVGDPTLRGEVEALLRDIEGMNAQAGRSKNEARRIRKEMGL